MLISNIRSAILPGTPRDPTGASRLERSAMKEFGKRIRQINREYIRVLKTIPSRPVINKKYVFLIDATLIEAVYSNLDSIVNSILLGRSERENWFLNEYVETAYQRGTAQSYSNLSAQSVSYRADVGELRDLLRSPPYARRIALVRSRSFEEMKNLSGEVKADMGRILADGVGRGLNPRDISRNLTEQSGIEERRANKIARTEVNTALRRARWDEDEEAAERYGLVGKELHLSALSPTTRPTHAARHGRLYSVDQVRDWYSEDGNSINCKCSQTFILLGDDGEPLVPSIVERARKTKQLMKKTSPGAWARG